MILHPGVMALLLGSGLTSALLCASALQGSRIIRHWDLASGSAGQLELERRTYLISTMMSYVLGFQVLSLFLFIHTVDSLSPMFIGAMCAAGSLKVNGFGYPTLIAKVVNCLLAGLWLIVNATDNKAPDYPLIRDKYRLLLAMTPLLLAEAALQGLYLLGLKPDIITSCCAIVFGTEANTVVGGLLALPLRFSVGVFFASAAVTVASSVYVAVTSRGARLLALASTGHLVVAIASLISFISLYFYELPTHHCPFCILHREYASIGYVLYLALLVGAIAGTGAGVIDRYRTLPTLRAIIPRSQQRLALISLLANLSFLAITGWRMHHAHLNLPLF